MGDFMETKREEIEGFAYVSGNGQIVIDRHATDEEHLLAKSTKLTQPLYDCRQYIADLIPVAWLERKGKFLVDRVTTTAGEVVSVSVSFIPTPG